MSAPAEEIQLLALSDDMTGASACAGEISLAWPDGDVVICHWSDIEPPRGTEALVVDTASRLLSVDEARERAGLVTRKLLQTAPPGVQWYKRIDSRLRGNVVAEISAMRDSLGLPVVLAPAAPALGVVTQGGVQRRVVDGRGRDLPPSPEPQASPEVLRWFPDAVCMAAAVLGDPDTQAALARYLADGHPVVCDMASAEDIESTAVALAGLAYHQPFLLVGSYGIAGALCRQRRMRPRHGEATTAPVLVVVGSADPASLAQAQRLEAAGANALRPWQAFAAETGWRRAAAMLADGLDVMVCLAATPGSGGCVTPAVLVGDAVASVLGEVVPAGVIIVGGELASSVARACGMTHAAVIAEPWPATPIVQIARDSGPPIAAVVKSGGIGDPDWLVRAVAVLRATGRDCNVTR